MRAALTVLSLVVVFGTPTAHAQYTAKEWPEGPSKARFAAVCDSCHDINRIRVGYTAEGWLSVVRMMQNVNAPVPAEEWGAMTDYLIKNFPERPRPPAAIIDGPVKAEIRMWDVPTLGSRPHDPLAARDGSIWWTGQLANKLGRLDPKTGAIREYTLKSAFTGPHGLAEDKTGNIWFTGNSAALIGRLDPSTGLVSEYPLPDPSAKDPHTLNFDQSGMLWFTVQQANMIGRLDPATGEIKLVTSPTPKSRPYGLKINGQGMPVVVEFGTNKIATIDPQTMAIKEYALPNPAARPRRLAIDPDGMVWYADFSRGYLGRLDLATGDVKEWPSPSGAKSEPYGIVFTNKAVWYSESAAKPNTIVRFDPATEQFQSWAIPGGGDIVRNMDVAPNGNPVIADSLTNQIGLVDIK
ncbi:Vgb family protein [Bradyrhizobium australiense]|uniref:Cytochrome C n=1 Tax=Bradyrhizobium australiense TaxID=2721161 RepID=A0A7Y4GTD4_9BRAD|nr:cytochrome C [Bradyrhizobium australiense]NOJ41243.1 cytochrome C [Bradyrhizobium australiense]